MIKNIFRISVFHSKNHQSLIQNLYRKSQRVVFQQRFFFSNQQYHPLIQRILSGELAKNPKPILGALKTLSKEDRETALKLILKNVYSHSIPNDILMDGVFLQQAGRHIEILIDALLYKIKVLISQIDEILHSGQIQNNKQKLVSLYNQITNHFTSCFSEFKKIPKEESLRTGIMLKKRYSDFCLLYMVNFTMKPEDKEVTLKNICESYRTIIIEMMKLINQEGSRVRLTEETPLAQGQNQQQKQFRVNSMKESLKIIVEANSQNVMHLMKAVVQLYKVTHNLEQYRQGAIQTISNIERALVFYNILKDMSVYSIFYLHLKKVKAQLNLFYKTTELHKNGGKANSKQEKELVLKFRKQVEQIYKEGESNLQKLGGQEKYLQNINQTALTMLSLKIHTVDQKDKEDLEEYKNTLLLEVQSILNKISNQNAKKSVTASLMSALKIVFKNHEEKKQQKN